MIRYVDGYVTKGKKKGVKNVRSCREEPGNLGSTCSSAITSYCAEFVETLRCELFSCLT